MSDGRGPVHGGGVPPGGPKKGVPNPRSGSGFLPGLETSPVETIVGSSVSYRTGSGRNSNFFTWGSGRPSSTVQCTVSPTCVSTLPHNVGKNRCYTVSVFHPPRVGEECPRASDHSGCVPSRTPTTSTVHGPSVFGPPLVPEKTRKVHEPWSGIRPGDEES